jgi:hypothetical protein
MSVEAAGPTAAQTGQLSWIISRFNGVVDELVAAKGRELTLADLKPIEELIAVDSFERVGIHREVMNWPEYARYMIAWAGATGFESSVRRVTEVGRLVYLELSERLTKTDGIIEKDTMMVYEFDETNKIRGMRVYHQCAP